MSPFQKRSWSLRMRDDFSAKIKTDLAQRVAHRCSNPNCRQSTCGPKGVESGVVNIGVAAHITAASLGGPRYRSELTAQQRKALDNAIWLCQNCAKLIDADESQYSAKTLLLWKLLAEERSRSELENRPQTGGHSTQKPWVVIDEYTSEHVEDETGQEYLWERVRIVNLGTAPAVSINIPRIPIGDRAVVLRGPFRSLQPGDFIFENISNFNAALHRALLKVPLPSQGSRSLRIPFVIEYRGFDHRLWTTEQEVAYSVFGITFPITHPNG